MNFDVEAAALEQVSNLLQRPDQLEKLPDLKKRADRKKLAVEAMLRTGVQGQLEGIRTAIAHLQTASEDVSVIKQGVSEIRQKLQPFPRLKSELRELRDANARHGQYAAAMENLKHIFNINSTLDEIREALDDEKSGANLLLAHKNIMDLERARDELLSEVHKMGSGNTEYEKSLLVNFFKGVDEVVNELSQNMWFILGRTLEMVKGNESGGGPQQVVTCIRIVEREERIDKYYLDNKKISDNAFMPPGRPRRWKEKALQVLEKTVVFRIEGNQLEDRSLNKAWLARYLEVCRNVIVDDLTVAKAAIPCFPPEYQIYDRFVAMYHNAVCKRLREIANEDLDKSELVQLMSWIKFYRSEDMLAHPKFKINAAALIQDNPILPKSTMNNLCDAFIDMSRNDLQLWLKNTVSHEKDDWYKNARPNEDNFGYFYTDLPNTVFGMLKDTVALAKEVSVDVIPSVINLTIEEFYDLAGKYKDAFTAFKNKYFEDRNRFREFTSNIIAIANNLHTCIESTEKYMQQIRLSMEGEQDVISTTGRRTMVSQKKLIENMGMLNSRWNNSASIAVNYLREEVITDIRPHLNELFSKKWLMGSAALETICMTISDYHSDHRHLRPMTRVALLMDLQFTIVSEYLKAVEQRRLTFTSYDERSEAGRKMKSDVQKIDQMFAEFSNVDDMADPLASLTSIVSCAGDVISLKDKSLLSLEATSFARKFPNCPAELLAAILATRDDITRGESKQLAEEVLHHVEFHPKDPLFDQLFSLRQTENTEWIPNFAMSNVFSTFMKKE